MKKSAFVLLGICLFVVGQVSGAALPIEEVKQIDSGGTPVMLGQRVTVTGVVTAGSGVYSTRDLDIYIEDSTGGINVYKRNGGWFKLLRGDSVVISGLVDQAGTSPKRGTTRITLQSLDDVEIIGRANEPEPAVLTARKLAQESTPPVEPYEGLLVRLVGVTISEGEWPGVGVEASIVVEDTSGTATVYIPPTTEIPGSSKPREPFILTGVVVQNDRSFPQLSGYVIWPRDRFGDFLTMGNGCGIVTVTPSLVEVGTESVDITLEIRGNGADTIVAFNVDLPLADGWGWDGGSVEMSGPGLEGATYEVLDSVIAVSGSRICDRSTYGRITVKGLVSPSYKTTSQFVVSTSVDGVGFAPVDRIPEVRCVHPKPLVVINEVYPDDGEGSDSDAFVELFNYGGFTARLEGFVLCEQRTVPYCDVEIIYEFTADDTIPPGDYLLVGASREVTQRFGVTPDVIAPVDPLGRISGHGGICQGQEKYEAITLWRDSELSELIDHCEYVDAERDTCELCDLGYSEDVFKSIPPVGYSLARRVEGTDTDNSEEDFVLSSEPTPGSQNIADDLKPPEVVAIQSYSQNVIEVFFNEPVASQYIDSDNFKVKGNSPRAVVGSLSGEKVILLCDDLEPGSQARLLVKEIQDTHGNLAINLEHDFEVSGSVCTDICEVQEFDAKGYSPLNGKSICSIGFITVPQGVFQSKYNSIYVQGLDGCGVNVFSYDLPSPKPQIGDLVYVSGTVKEYSSATAGSVTEIVMPSASNLTILSEAYPEPQPVVLKTGEVGREENEGKFVETEGVIVTASDYAFYINDGTGGIQVYQNYTPIDFTRFKPGMYVRVRGVVLQYDYTVPFLEGYELVPRFDRDIEIIEGAFPEDAVLEVEPYVFCPSCGDEGFAITLGTPSQSHITLRIFDVRGRLIDTLYDGVSTGEMKKVWTGRDTEGRPVAPGLYICFLEAVETTTGRRLTKSVPIVVGMRLK